MPPSCALLADLQSVHGFRGYGNTMVIRQAHRTPHALRMRAAKTPLTGDKIDAPAACDVPFRPYCGGVVTQMQNVSKYMLVLALCLFQLVLSTVALMYETSHWFATCE